MTQSLGVTGRETLALTFEIIQSDMHQGGGPLLFVAAQTEAVREELDSEEKSYLYKWGDGGAGRCAGD